MQNFNALGYPELPQKGNSQVAGRDWEFVENFEDGLRIDVLTPRKGWNVIGYCRYEYYLGFQKVWSISDLNEARDDALTEQHFFSQNLSKCPKMIWIWLEYVYWWSTSVHAKFQCSSLSGTGPNGNSEMTVKIMSKGGARGLWPLPQVKRGISSFQTLITVQLQSAIQYVFLGHSCCIGRMLGSRNKSGKQLEDVILSLFSYFYNLYFPCFLS